MNKKILLPSILGIAVVACAIAVNANFGAMKQNIRLEQYNRLEAERKLDTAIKNSQRLDEQLKEAKRKLQGIQNLVSEGESTTNQLKSTVEATSKENEDLKQTVKKLQEDLAASQKLVAERQAAAVPVAPPPVAAN